MAALDNKQLLNLIRYAPVAVVFVFAFAVNMIAISDNREQANLSIQNLREELILQRKEAIRSQVHQVYKQILLEKSKAESELKNLAKQRVYEAFGIANYIYAQNIEKSKAEISKLIVEALRPIRFFDGRGYFFILNNEGATIMNGANPDLEGQNTWNLQDANGHFLARNMLKITAGNGEGVLSWRYKKPGSITGEELEKVGYIKKFEPYNWSIATGEYLRDYESDLKRSLLKWFSEYEYGEGGYFFVVDNKGTLLAHHINDFLSLNLSVGSKLDSKLMDDITARINAGGGYIRFSKPLTLSGNVALEQVSYVKEIKEWGWVIGTGFSPGTLEKHLRQKEEQLVALNHESFMRLIYLTIGSMILLTGCSLYAGNLIARRFEMFQEKIKKDFNKLTQSKNKMEYMALHDALTSLPNRILILKKIQQGIGSTARKNTHLAVMFVDLDNFKKVNDLHGHQVGDQLLEKVSRQFEILTSSSGSVSRFGGDEFIFCFPNLKSKEEVQEKVLLIRESLSAAFVIAGRSLSVGCSIGVSMYPDDSSDAEALIRQADTVLYRAKAQKKGQALFYSQAINDQINRKSSIEEELIIAIKNKDLSVYYQPQMSAGDGKLIGVEALARWTHSVLGPIRPDEFIAIAEESGQIHDLGMLVFRKACEDIFSLSENGTDALKLSVNISPAQLMEPDFFNSIQVICTDVGIDAKRITLEVTENIFIHSLDVVEPILRRFREEGFGLSLDDFGTGYSSLSYINALPLTEIKIDRSFVNKFLDSYQSDMLVRMIIGVGRLCGLIVVAEGVESETQHKKLVNYGCDLLQGYYLDCPLTKDELLVRVDNAREKNDKLGVHSSDV